ncbi:MAG: ABC transporter substrate-binding protein, partial [Hyphomicrobiaceae bacterium]
MAGIRQGLAEFGYVEGQNLTIEYRWADGVYHRLPALAAELISARVDVIVTQAPPAARAAKSATPTIPIVFAVGTDPVVEGLVASLARPGGNVTGVTLLSADLMAKRLDLISELVPRARLFALLVNPQNPNNWISEAQAIARAKGVQLQGLNAETP